VRKILARRTLRIFPLYYVVLLCYVGSVAATRGGPTAAAFWRHLPSFATYTSNWVVNLRTDTSVTFYFAWSLATEERSICLGRRCWYGGVAGRAPHSGC
jgi:peptidoglycan/LPS O-acetylase OafA/YrhL